MKWEDKLLGQKFTLVTDHKGLEYFKTQPILSPQQVRWWEYLSHFNYDTIHVDGERNRVADALSCYYEYDTAGDKHPNKEFVKADEVLNPKGELLPVERFVEIRTNAIRKSHRLRDKPSDAVAESIAINNTNTTINTGSSPDDDDVVAIHSGNDKESLHTRIEESFNLTNTVKQAYRKDKLYSKILEKPKAHALFGCKDSLIFTKNLLKRDILCCWVHICILPSIQV